MGTGANRPDAQDGQFFTPQLRWAKWDSEGRTLEVGVGPAVAPRSKCAIFYVYLPLSPQSHAPPLLFSGEGVPRGVSKALEAVSERASGKRTPLSVLVDQAVTAIDAGMRLEELHSSLWSRQALLDSEISFDDVASACKQNRKALDVLVCFAAAACRSIKKVSLLDPFPPAFYDALGGTDFDACTQCLLALPPLGSLFDESSDSRHHLSTQQGLLLRWLCDLKGVELKVSIPLSLPPSIPLSIQLSICTFHLSLLHSRLSSRCMFVVPFPKDHDERHHQYDPCAGAKEKEQATNQGCSSAGC